MVRLSNNSQTVCACRYMLPTCLAQEYGGWGPGAFDLVCFVKTLDYWYIDDDPIAGQRARVHQLSLLVRVQSPSCNPRATFQEQEAKALVLLFYPPSDEEDEPSLPNL